MHLIQFLEIMRDAEVAYAIHPIVHKYLLTVEHTTEALIACGVPRAANVAQITSALDRTMASLKERKSIAKGESAPTVEAAILVDNPLSQND
jgi:hypothetical protein